jgi:hypothetical protein
MARNIEGNETPPAPIPGPKGSTGNLFPDSESDSGNTGRFRAVTGEAIGSSLTHRRLAGVTRQDPPRQVESLAGEARDRTERLTTDLLESANHHGEVAGVTSQVWTEQSNVVQAGQLPRAAGPVIGRNTKANPAGFPERSLTS